MGRLISISFRYWVKDKRFRVSNNVTGISIRVMELFIYQSLVILKLEFISSDVKVEIYLVNDIERILMLWVNSNLTLVFKTKKLKIEI